MSKLELQFISRMTSSPEQTSFQISQSPSEQEEPTNVASAQQISPTSGDSKNRPQRRRKKQYVLLWKRTVVDLFLDLTLCFCFRYAVSVQWEQEVAEGRAKRDFHSFFCCCARRIGHMFALISYPDGTPVVIAGPCWPFCMFVTVPLIVGVSGLVCYFLIINNSYATLVRA